MRRVRETKIGRQRDKGGIIIHIGRQKERYRERERKNGREREIQRQVWK